jgi:hypothetical protein
VAVVVVVGGGKPKPRNFLEVMGKLTPENEDQNN